MEPGSESEAELPTFSDVRISSQSQFRHPQRHAYLIRVLGQPVVATFDPQVIKGAVDGFYTGSAELYADEIARLARALVARGAVMSWLGRGSHIASVMRKVRAQQ
jgi:hypothetical protein